jgi:hypothetical protein
LRSIEDVLATKKLELAEVSSQIATLEAALRIVNAESNGKLPMAVSPGVPAEVVEPRGIPNIAANPMATQPPPKRWP